jgi:hypothetical protein
MQHCSFLFLLVHSGRNQIDCATLCVPYCTQFRTTRNYTDATFLGPRIGDKLVMGLLMMTL